MISNVQILHFANVGEMVLSRVFLEKTHDSFFIPRTRNVNTMKHLKAGNVCRAARGCPFGKKDGRPFVCAAAPVCGGFSGTDRQRGGDAPERSGSRPPLPVAEKGGMLTGGNKEYRDVLQTSETTIFPT